MVSAQQPSWLDLSCHTSSQSRNQSPMESPEVVLHDSDSLQPSSPIHLPADGFCLASSWLPEYYSSWQVTNHFRCYPPPSPGIRIIGEYREDAAAAIITNSPKHFRNIVLEYLNVIHWLLKTSQESRNIFSITRNIFHICYDQRKHETKLDWHD